MKKEDLARPFPPELIKTRPGRNGQQLAYVETHAVIARLNEVCETWSYEILRHEILDNEVIVCGKLTADGVSKMAFGTSAITRDRDGQAISVGDDLKSASSDALKKSATLLGVGLHLYGAGAPAAASPNPATTTPRPPTAPDERITSKQLGAVQSIARRKNIDRDDLAARLGERFGKAELQHLSKREASTLLSELLEANGANRV
ncbi:MAG: Rad52/Rad22 family DNA repair protein [Polyangiaceae bacterium]